MGEARQKAATEAARWRHGVVIQCLGVISRVAIPERSNPAGLYLKTADLEWRDGIGHVEWTGKIEDAMVFKDLEHAREFWNDVPRCRPTRPDGQPNRPLTIFGSEFIPAPAPGHRSTPFAAPGLVH